MVSWSSNTDGGITATKLDSSQRVIYSFSLPSVSATVTAAAVDSHGSLIIGGWTDSVSFPRVNPLFYPRLPTSILDQRGFVAKLDPAGSGLMFSTLVWGNELSHYYQTSVTALAVDSADRIYLSGSTTSPTLPVSANAYQPTGGDPNGYTSSGFVMRISNAGDSLQFCTYLGGQSQAKTRAMIVDGHGITFAGTNGGTGISATNGAYDCHCASNFDTTVFVSRFDADATALQWSAVLFDVGIYSGQPVISLSVDNQANTTVAVTTTNKALPVTPGALQMTDGVTTPIYVSYPTTGYLATISNDGTSLLHSTYYGGTAFSTLRGMVQDPDGNYWITGDAHSPDLPVPAGSLNLGTSYLAKLDSSMTHVLRYYGVPWGAAGQTLNIVPNGELVVSGEANSILRMPADGPTQPSIWGAAGAAERWVTPRISGGELISLYGVQLGPDPGASGTLDSSGKLGTDISGYGVLVNGIPAPLLFAGPNQINLVVPFGIANDTDAAIQVITPSGPLTPVSGLAVGPTEPQVFPVILNEDGSVNSKDSPAPRNSIVTMWATGGAPWIPEWWMARSAGRRWEISCSRLRSISLLYQSLPRAP